MLGDDVDPVKAILRGIPRSRNFNLLSSQYIFMNSFISFEFQSIFVDLIACTKFEIIFLELSSNRANAFLSLTASASKGRAGGRFFYYHCSGGCKERQKAFDMNIIFIHHLKEYNNSPKYMELFATILKGNLKNCNNTGKKEVEKITGNIAKLKMRLKNAKDMMLDGEFSAGDYKTMKIEIEEELEKMNREEMQIRQGIENYDTKIDECLDLLLNLDKYYDTKNTEVKQKIIGSVFPEKLYFKDNEYRTTKLNEAVEILCKTDKGLGKKKGGKKSEFSASSLRVESEGFEPSSKQGINVLSTCLLNF